MISGFSDLIICFLTLLTLFLLAKDICKTLFYSYIAQRDNEFSYDNYSYEEKKSRRYRYDEDILQDEDF